MYVQSFARWLIFNRIWVAVIKYRVGQALAGHVVQDREENEALLYLMGVINAESSGFNESHFVKRAPC